MISVVIPLYNKEHTLAPALRSVLGQTYQDFEIIVVDDGSTDQGPAEVTKFEDRRIRLIQQENQGVSAARNRGVAEARAEWVAFLDADDEWLPGFLSRIQELQRRFPACEVAATSYFLQELKGLRRQSILVRAGRAREFIFRDYFATACKSEPPLHSSAIAVKKTCLAAIGGFPVGIAAGEDLLTWARLASRHLIAYSREPFSIFHQDPRCSDGKPSRRPDDQDAVGRHLRFLLSQASPDVLPNLRSYVGLWYKMRASIYLRLGERRKAVRAAMQALGYMPFEKRLYVYCAATALPLPLTLRLFRLSKRG